MRSKRELVRRVVARTVLLPDCLEQYANLTGTPYGDSDWRLRSDLNRRGKLARKGSQSYLTITVWDPQRPYRLHVRRDAEATDEFRYGGYRLERLNVRSANSTAATARHKRRRR